LTRASIDADMLFTGVDGTLSKDTFVTSVSAGSVPPEPNVIPGPDHEVNMLSARNLHGDRSLANSSRIPL